MSVLSRHHQIEKIMHELIHYWWIIPLLLIGVIFGAVRDLSKVDHTQYLNRPKKKQEKPNDDKPPENGS